MTNEDLKNIVISDEPKTGLKRVVDLSEFAFNREQNFLKVKWKVLFLDKNQERIEDVLSATAPYYIETYASNSGLVNPLTGEYVGYVEEINDKTGLMGEYSFFLLYAENPIEIFPLLISKAQQADNFKRFDK